MISAAEEVSNNILDETCIDLDVNSIDIEGVIAAMDDSVDSMENDEMDMIDLTNWEMNSAGDDTASHAMNGQHTPEDEVECEVIDVSEHNAEPWSSDENLLLAEGVALHTSRDPATRLIDWYQVAKHVRSRSVSECCFQWLQKVQAEVITCIKKSWKQEEMDALLVAVAKQNSPSNYINWNLVAEQIPSRTPLQCCAAWFYRSNLLGEKIQLTALAGKGSVADSVLRDRWSSLQKRLPFSRAGKEWTLEEEATLLEAIDKSAPNNVIDWKAVASELGQTREAQECRNYFNSSMRPYITIRLGPWSPLEDALLGAAVQQMKSFKIAEIDWMDVVKYLQFQRTAEQCRKRWIKHLYDTHELIRARQSAAAQRSHSTQHIIENTGPWTPLENALLGMALQKQRRGYFSYNIDWELVVKVVKHDRSAPQCRRQWETIFSAARGRPWTSEENAKLKDAVTSLQSSGNAKLTNWEEVEKIMCQTRRTSRACKAQWLRLCELSSTNLQQASTNVNNIEQFQANIPGTSASAPRVDESQEKSSEAQLKIPPLNVLISPAVPANIPSLPSIANMDTSKKNVDLWNAALLSQLPQQQKFVVPNRLLLQQKGDVYTRNAGDALNQEKLSKVVSSIDNIDTSRKRNEMLLSQLQQQQQFAVPNRLLLQQKRTLSNVYTSNVLDKLLNPEKFAKLPNPSGLQPPKSVVLDLSDDL